MLGLRFKHISGTNWHTHQTLVRFWIHWLRTTISSLWLKDWYCLVLKHLWRHTRKMRTISALQMTPRRTLRTGKFLLILWMAREADIVAIRYLHFLDPQMSISCYATTAKERGNGGYKESPQPRSAFMRCKYSLFTKQMSWWILCSECRYQFIYSNM